MTTPRTLDELYAFWRAIRAEQDALDARYAADRAVEAARSADAYVAAVAANDEQAWQRRQRLRSAQGPAVECSQQRWSRREP